MANDYGLDLHCQMILDEYRERQDVFAGIRDIVLDRLRKCLDEIGLFVTACEARIKSEESLAGKLELKGSKYSSLSDITDIVGARVVTFYTDDVDKIASHVESLFEVDWNNSVDKRKMHELDSFGYMSLHYVCRIPKSLYFDPERPEINEYACEIQLRTTLQHMWANMNHDIGYKTGVEIPVEYLRSINRLAGMLELADDEFSRIRTAINDYRRKVQALVASGSFEDVPLNGDTFRSYLQLGPFDKLNSRIAAINQAEIHKTSALKYIAAFKALGFKTLGDLDRLIKECSDEAYELARFELGKTDLDIVSSTVAIQDLCVAHILKQGTGAPGLKFFFDQLDGESEYNGKRAERIVQAAAHLSFMNKTNS